MQDVKSAAARLADQIFDQIEQDRVLIRERIEEICEDGLTLFAAKSQNGVASSLGDEPARILVVEARKLCELFTDASIRFSVPGTVVARVDRIAEALRLGIGV
jgi:hypothetical protein